MIQLKLSTKTNGIVYRNLSDEKVLELIKANLGTDGPRKITVEWGIDEETPVVKPTEATDGILLDKLDDSIPTNAPEKDKVPSKFHNSTETQQASLGGSHEPAVLSKIGNINQNEFTTAKFIPIETNLSFAETSDGRITIKYAGTKVNTTWKDLLELELSVNNPIPRGVAVLKENDSGNRRTAVTRFINKMRSDDIEQGDGVRLFKEIFKDKSGININKDDVDPDADFRPTGVGSSVYPPASPAGQDFGHG